MVVVLVRGFLALQRLSEKLHAAQVVGGGEIRHFLEADQQALLVRAHRQLKLHGSQDYQRTFCLHCGSMRIYEGPTGTSHEVKYSFDEFTTRPSIRFKTSERPDSPTTTKVCGTPYLPEYAPYPYRSGEPMYFIAQFNFSEFDPLPGFPTTGLLQLFVSDDDMWGDNYRDTVKDPSDHEPTQNARYLPDTTKPHIGEVPESVLDSGEHPAIDPLEATTISGVRTDQFVTLGSKEFNTYAFSPRKPHALLRRGSDLQTLHIFRGRIVSRRVIGDQEEVCTTRAWTDDKCELQAMF